MSLPWSAGSDCCGGVKLDVKRSTDRNQAGTPRNFRSDPGGRPSAGGAGFLGVCVVGWWDSGFSLACSKEQDYREFSNLRSLPPERRFRKRERRFGKSDPPLCKADFRLEICLTVPPIFKGELSQISKFMLRPFLNRRVRKAMHGSNPLQKFHLQCQAGRSFG